jgi:hypothetical protein
MLPAPVSCGPSFLKSQNARSKQTTLQLVSLRRRLAICALHGVELCYLLNKRCFELLKEEARNEIGRGGCPRDDLELLLLEIAVSEFNKNEFPASVLE